MNSKVVVVIPVYNNPKTIAKVVKDALLLSLSVIVVDDGSDDKVEDLLEKDSRLMVMRHTMNKGKGEALLTAARMAKEEGFEYMIAIDGDGQHFIKVNFYIEQFLI